jgi:2-polyprenyl-6-methoxyphenol hydroxylase-like FAD-dependent oxidoreductase
VAADELCDQVRHYKCPFGGTLGDLMNRTSKERLSKVMLEEKYFQTWWHMRTVLVGDACHKVHILHIILHKLWFMNPDGALAVVIC